MDTLLESGEEWVKVDNVNISSQYDSGEKQLKNYIQISKYLTQTTLMQKLLTHFMSLTSFFTI